jgi:hypothetical protein
MNALTKYAIILIVLCGHATAASGKELVREFKGSESRYTGEFEVQAPWILDWRVTSDVAPAVEVALLQAGTGVFVGSALRTKQTGNGVRLFEESGRFQFRVNSTLASWTLRVEQLTRAEAGQYTPLGEDPGKEVDQ